MARATGLTVRTLHHYDRLGLLTPARDNAGRRCYTAADVRRLHRIVALQGFGLSLGEIGLLLASSGPDPREVLRRQLEQAEERIAVARRLRGSVLGVLSALGQQAGTFPWRPGSDWPCGPGTRAGARIHGIGGVARPLA